ncbi:unnamed protein product [Euphydryas editha]|uniref:Uncharacterized protein n=1 Tax=Euphydryas editha TaxID=104508 RepID=A0AAU9V3N8_EUPED|nr:unnamed protein product [Euphydryas editha]
MTLFINGYQTLDVNKFVNNVKPVDAYKKLQTDVNKTQNQIKEQLLPNQIKKSDESDLNKYSEALKGIDEKVKNYQSNQGSSVIQPLISNQILPNQIERLDKFEFKKHSDALKEIDEKVKNYQSNQGSSIIQPLISNQVLPNQIEKLDKFELNKHSDTLKEIEIEKVKNYQSNQGSPVIPPLISNQQQLNYQQIVQDKLKVINPLSQSVGLTLQRKPNILGQQTQPIFKDLNHQLIDTLVKNQLPVIPNQQFGQIFDKLQQPGLQSVFNTLPFNHPLMSSQSDLPIMQHIVSSFLPQSKGQQSIFNLVNQVTHPNRHAGYELLSMGPNVIDFMNKAPILQHKDNILYILLNNLGMSKENTMVIPVQL